jgi:glucose-1-phosphate cytidylyltransferase
MVPVGDYPILWHIMKHFASYGHKDYVLCLGYLGEVIKHYFLHYEIQQTDVVMDMGKTSCPEHLSCHEEQDWRVVLANTGLDTNTGARVKRIEQYIKDDTFLLTYGDGVSDIDLDALVSFHKSHGKMATVSAVHPPARFGELELAGERVVRFSEKPQTSVGLINGGFLVFNKDVFGYMESDEGYSLERDLLSRLAADEQLMAYKHDGFWQCMDTVRELTVLDDLWRQGRAPWKRW